jgi:hypothetical protein
MAFHYSPKLVQDSLVFYFDPSNSKSLVPGNTGYLDLSKNEWSGTLVNGASFSSNNYGSIVFDGVNDYITTNYTTAFGTDNLTISVWFNFSVSQIGALFSKRVGSPTFEQLSIFISGNVNGSISGAKISVNDNNISFNRNYLSSRNFNDGFWHNFVVVRDTNQNRYFIDGVLDNVVVSTKPNLSTSSRVFFGTTGDNLNPSTLYYNGRMGSIYLYSRPLTNTEVRQNFDSIKSRYSL